MAEKKSNPALLMTLTVVVLAVIAIVAIVIVPSLNNETGPTDNQNGNGTQPNGLPNNNGQTNIANAGTGFNLLANMGCIACHSIDGSVGLAASFAGLYGGEVTLEDGTIIIADDEYIIESIREPQAKIVDGFEDTMGAYSEGMLSGEDIQHIIAYLKTLAQ